MKKRFWLCALLALALLTAGCETKPEKSDGGDLPAGAVPSSFVMEATVSEVGERILVEVTQSEYTSGPHFLIVTDQTAIKNESGKPLSKEAIRVGDLLTVIYNGQVMLSYPPQVVALSITVK